MKIKQQAVYKFKLHTEVIYIGGLYELYHNEIATIISRGNIKKNGDTEYRIQFKKDMEEITTFEKILIEVNEKSLEPKWVKLQK